MRYVLVKPAETMPYGGFRAEEYESGNLRSVVESEEQSLCIFIREIVDGRFHMHPDENQIFVQWSFF